MKPLVAIGALVAALAFSKVGAAAPPAECPQGEQPWLRLELGPSLAPVLAVTVAAKLQAELDRWNIALCASVTRDDAPPPLAVIALALDAGDVLLLQVADRATDKRLERSISLRGIPKDALALSIAVAAEELLHASWFEALVDRTETPSPLIPPPAPPLVERVAIESLAPRARVRRNVGGSLAIAFAGEHATGGVSLGGFDARASYGGALRAEVRVGYRLGVAATANDGEVATSALLFGAAIVATTPRAAPWGGELFARVDGVRVVFSGRASASDVQAFSATGFGALAGGGIGGWRSLDDAGVWRLNLEASFAMPLRAVAALDDGRTVTALSGPIVGLALGIACVL